jgi:internalin A
MTAQGQAGHVIEETPEGQDLVVTGPWSNESAEVLARGDIDGLVLNYAHGFVEPSLEFLGSWPIRRLNVLDRSLSDLKPLARLGDSLERLSIQAAPGAELDLAALPNLRALGGEWGLIRETLSALTALERLITWRFDEIDLHAFRDHVCLERLTLKDAPYLESLAGIGELSELAFLGIIGGPKLEYISEVAERAQSLRELEFQDCSFITDLNDIAGLINLRFLGVSNCGDIESLAPIGSLHQLEVLYAWGSTRVVDGDLSPLTHLPQLREIRMRDRAAYTPRKSDLTDKDFRTPLGASDRVDMAQTNGGTPPDHE